VPVKRAAVIVVLSLLVMPTSAVADSGHERPKITTLRFAQPPLKSGINETLNVTAHDPDSWISEIQVRWEDTNHNGGVVFAHTGCVQDLDFSNRGIPAKLKIPILFENPGRYHVEARAQSSERCRGDDTTRTSRTLEMDVTVVDPLKSMTDPDDAGGALDIATIEQTQQSSETSATTEIVHRFSMFEAWTNDRLAGPAYIEMSFDLDGVASTVERVLTIDMDESDSTLRASMVDATSGEGRGYAVVKRPDGRTIEVRFPPLMLKKGLREYRWHVWLDDGSQDLCPPGGTCIDRAPDRGVMRHAL
jgi:hypothetical protein